MRTFKAEDLEKLLSMKELIEVMKDALFDLDRHNIIVPDRHHISSSLHDSTYLFMPVYSEKLDKVGFKYVAVCNENSNIGLPVINGVVFLADGKTGIVEAMFDGAKLTALRTGAVGGAAIDILASDDAKVLSVFGTGVQAETQIRASISVRKIEKIYLYYRNKDKANRFVSIIKQYFLGDIILTDNLRFLEESDIIIAATNSKHPLFDSSKLNLKEHVHINAIGSFKPDMQEIDSNLYQICSVFADNKDGCIKESGDIILALRDGRIKEDEIINLGAVISSNENYKNKRTIFKSVGNAGFDLYSAYMFYKSG